jgi:hypothetical protein
MHVLCNQFPKPLNHFVASEDIRLTRWYEILGKAFFVIGRPYVTRQYESS